MSNRPPRNALPLLLSLGSILLFPLGIYVLETYRQVLPLLGIAAVGVCVAVAGVVSGFGRLRQKVGGARYGFAVSGGIAGIFAVLFWCIMVPLLIVFALPARQQDPSDPIIEESRQQMRIIVRQIKTFQREEGRMPVKVEELVEKGYLNARVLYDPRDRLKQVPSYRIMLQELPPESESATRPLLEGRWPDPDGKRMIAYPDESFGLTR